MVMKLREAIDKVYELEHKIGSTEDTINGFVAFIENAKQYGVLSDESIQEFTSEIKSLVKQLDKLKGELEELLDTDVPID